MAYGYLDVKGLNAQLAVLSTPLAAPVIAGVRLRKGNVAFAHVAPRLIADAVATARRCGADWRWSPSAQTPPTTSVPWWPRSGPRGPGSRSPPGHKPQITKAIASIDPDAWTAIK